MNAAAASVLFDVVFYVAAPFWALMIILPRWRWTVRIVESPLVVVPAVAIYVVLIATQLPRLLAAVVRPSLAGVGALLTEPVGVAAVWAHLIAFDLFVGRWMYLDSRQRAVHPLVMAPLLILTILLGPVGLLCYLVVRYAAYRRVRTEPAGQSEPAPTPAPGSSAPGSSPLRSSTPRSSRPGSSLPGVDG